MKRKQNAPKTKAKSGDASMIVAALALLGVIWFFMKKSKPESPPALPAKAEPAAPQIFSSPQQLAKDQAESQQRSQLFVQERAAGLLALPVKRTDKGTFELKVSTHAFERGCMQGDLDVMKEDLRLRRRKEPALRLSLENLDPASNQKPVQVQLSLAQLKKGVNYTFQPHYARTQLLGSLPLFRGCGKILSKTQHE